MSAPVLPPLSPQQDIAAKLRSLSIDHPQAPLVLPGRYKWPHLILLALAAATCAAGGLWALSGPHSPAPVQPAKAAQPTSPPPLVAPGGVSIIGYLNMAGRIAASSSALLARNIFSFVEPMIDKSTKSLAIKRDDEIIAATLLTADGAIVHKAFAPKTAPAGGQA